MSNFKQKCLYCGDEFWSQRTTAKYCSTKCRIAYNKLPARIDSMVGQARTTMFQLQEWQSIYPAHADQMVQGLDHLRDILNIVRPLDETTETGPDEDLS